MRSLPLSSLADERPDAIIEELVLMDPPLRVESDESDFEEASIIQAPAVTHSSPLDALAAHVFEPSSALIKSFPQSGTIYVVRCFVPSPAASLLFITGGNDSILRFIDVDFGQEVARHFLHDAILALDVGDGDLVVAGCVSGALIACRYGLSAPPRRWATLGSAVVGISLVDGMCAVGDEAGAVSLWSLVGVRVMQVMHHHGHRCVSGVALGAAGLLSCGYDGTVRLVDRTGRRVLGTHVGEVNAAAFCARGAASVGDDGVLRMWALEPVTNVASAPGAPVGAAEMHHPAGVFSLATHPTRSWWVATGTNTGLVVVWDVLVQMPVLCVQLSEARVNSICFSPNGRTLLCCTHTVFMVDVFHKDKARLRALAGAHLGLPSDILRVVASLL